MNQSVNKVILIGNLGKDPEVRHFENGGVVASFSLATSESYLDSQSGERREVTDWHDVVAWRGLAIVAEKILCKGARVYLEGKLKKRSYQDKEGNPKMAMEVVAEELILLSKPDPKHVNAAPYSKINHTHSPTPEPFTDHDEDILPF